MISVREQNRITMYPTGVQIRAFQPKDQKATSELILAGLKDHFGWVDYARNPDLDDIMRYYVRAGHVFVVAEEGQEIVGAGGLKIAGVVGSIVRVSVTGKRRRKGIGRGLVMYLLALASQRNLKEVTIVTNNDWADAIALYERCGFTEFARNNRDVFMRRQLPALWNEPSARTNELER